MSLKVCWARCIVSVCSWMLLLLGSALKAWVCISLVFVNCPRGRTGLHVPTTLLLWTFSVGRYSCLNARVFGGWDLISFEIAVYFTKIICAAGSAATGRQTDPFVQIQGMPPVAETIQGSQGLAVSVYTRALCFFCFSFCKPASDFRALSTSI